MSRKLKINRPQLAACVLGVVAVAAVSLVTVRCNTGRNISAPVVIVNVDSVAADTAKTKATTKPPRSDKRDKNRRSPVVNEQPSQRNYLDEKNN